MLLKDGGMVCEVGSKLPRGLVTKSTPPFDFVLARVE